MNMRIKRISVLIAASLAVLSAGLGCQTAKKPVSVPPAFHASTPPIQAATPAKAGPAPTAAIKSSTPSVAPVENKLSRPKPDPVAELIAKAEKEYQSGLDR